MGLIQQIFRKNMSQKSLDQLVKSSTKAASEQLQHLLVVLTTELVVKFSHIALFCKISQNVCCGQFSN